MPAHSIQACSACKKHKRRCDKALPVCSLCRRTRRDCTYDAEPAPVPTPADWAHMQARLAALESLLPTTSVRDATPIQTSTASTSVPPSTVGASSHDEANSGETRAPSTVDGSVGNEGQDTDAVFPSSLFLDIDCYVWSHARLPVMAGGIPAVRCLTLIPPSATPTSLCFRCSLFEALELRPIFSLSVARLRYPLSGERNH